MSTVKQNGNYISGWGIEPRPLSLIHGNEETFQNAMILQQKLDQVAKGNKS